MSNTKSRNLNVAIISPEYPTYTNNGGVATYNLDLANILSKIVKSVDVITYDGQGANEFTTKQNNVTTRFIKFKTNWKLINFIYYKFPFGILRRLLLRKLGNFLFIIDWNIFSLIAFYKLNKSKKIDVIHTPSYVQPALLIKLFYPRIKLITHLHGDLDSLYPFPNKPKFDYSILIWLENLYFKHFSDIIISCSISAKNRLLKRLPSLGNKIQHIPNFIDLNKYQPTHSLNNNNLIFYGRKEYRKGIDIVISSFVHLAKTNKDITLYLIGDDHETVYKDGSYFTFAEYFKNLKINPEIKRRINLIPRIDDKQTLINLLKLISGIVILPARYEPFGLTTIESMALSLMVIASSSGGGSEIITDAQNGYLAEPTVNSLSTKIQEARLLKPSKSAKITLEARLTVKNKYSLNVALKNYLKFYSSI